MGAALAGVAGAPDEHEAGDRYEGKPLDWALYGWGHGSPRKIEQRDHSRVVALLIRAGAQFEPEWYANLPGLVEKARADARMGPALSGALPGE